MDKCPNCNRKLKDNMLGFVSLVNELTTQLINDFLNIDGIYCTKCCKNLRDKAIKLYKDEFNISKKTLEELINYVPVISLNQPLGWDYQVKSLVTSQSVIGTGILAEFTSDWTDFFGTTSGTYGSKLKKGEGLCLSQLKLQAIELGANAVIASDIDYGEAGGTKGMLMICIAGTAVKVLNTDVMPDYKRIEQLQGVYSRHKYLMKFYKLVEAAN